MDSLAPKPLISNGDPTKLLLLRYSTSRKSGCPPAYPEQGKWGNTSSGVLVGYVTGVEHSVPIETLWGHSVLWGDESLEPRTIEIEERAFRLSPLQYRLLVPLLTGKPISRGRLMREMYGSTFDHLVRRAFDKQLDRLRLRMERANSPLRIYTIRGYGYILLPNARGTTRQPQRKDRRTVC